MNVTQLADMLRRDNLLCNQLLVMLFKTYRFYIAPDIGADRSDISAGTFLFLRAEFMPVKNKCERFFLHITFLMMGFSVNYLKLRQNISQATVKTFFTNPEKPP